MSEEALRMPLGTAGSSPEAWRIAHFQALLDAFGPALTRGQAAAAVLEHGMPVVDAVFGSVYLVGPDNALELVASRGGAPDEPFRSIPLPSELPVCRVAATGEAIWAESFDGAGPEARLGSAAAPRLLWAVLPLSLDERTLGVLVFGFADRREFTAIERAYLSGFCQLFAQALERGRLLEEERQARRAAEAAGARLRLLAEAGALLAGSLDYDATVAAVARLALGSFADWCVVELVDDAGEVRRVEVEHADPAKAGLREELQRQPSCPRRSAALRRAFETGRAQLVESRCGCGDAESRTAHIVLDLGLGSIVIAPLLARGRRLGALTFVRASDKACYGADDVALAEDLACRAALAMDNARLLAEARQSEEESRRHAERLRILAEASRAFAEASPSLDAVLDGVTRQLAEAIGDASLLCLLDPERGQLNPLSLHHRRPESLPLLQRLVAEVSYSRPPELVAASQQARCLGRVDDSRLRAAVVERARSYFDAVGVSSLVVAPLRVENQVLGTLILSRDRGGPAYDGADEALVQDLAHRAALAIHSARLYQGSQQAVRVRDEFISIAGHELRTPLTAMQLQVQAILRLSRECRSDPLLVGRTEKMARSVERLSGLVEDLLDVSRISGGRLDLELEEMDLTRVVKELVEREQDELDRSNCEVAVHGRPVCGRWDRRRIEQIVANLLENAIKFGRGMPIEVRVEEGGGRARLSVADRGIGIAHRDQERIFERFERAVSARSFGGLGLGLWVAREVAGAHGGSIWVESEPGKGARFIVDLPLRGPEEGTGDGQADRAGG